MAEYSKLYITNNGQALMAKMIAGSGNIDFTKVCSSSTQYTESQLQALTALSNIKQTTLVSKVTRTNEVAIKIDAAYSNVDLKEGYYMRTLGLYAVDPDKGEILYAVCIEKSNNCYMPPYNGVTVSAAYLQLYTTVGNADSVSLAVSPGAYATVGDIQALEKEIADLKAYVGYSDGDIYGVEVDFENKKFTRLAGTVNRSAGSGFDGINAFGGRKRCNLTNDGRVAAYYGEAGFSTTGKLTQAVDRNPVGTESPDENLKFSAGTIVQVMVEQPKFYYKVVPLKTEKRTKGAITRKIRYYVSDTPKAGFKLHPAFIVNGQENDVAYLAAFEGSLWDASASAYILDDSQVADFAADMLCSIANAKPLSGLTQNATRDNIRKLAEKRGTGWEQGVVQTASASQMLMLIEYATFNMQSVIGNGAVSKTDDGKTSMTENTGATITLGNASGSVVNANGIQMCHTVVRKTFGETFGGGLMESITMQMQPQVNVIPMLQIMVLLMTVRQHLMKIQECVQSMETVIFPLSVIQKILIGCSYRVSSTETPPFLLVIIVGIRTVLVGVSLYWVLVGIVACMPVLSIGICIVLLLIVLGLSAVGWCIEKR